MSNQYPDPYPGQGQGPGEPTAQVPPAVPPAGPPAVPPPAYGGPAGPAPLPQQPVAPQGMVPVPQPSRGTGWKIATAVLLTLLAVGVVAAAFLLGRGGDETTEESSTTSSSSSSASTTAPSTTAPATTAPPATVGDVRNQPAGLLCRDLRARGFSYSASVDYWRVNGQPDRMDADGDGIPCETVYPTSDVIAYWGTVGRSVEGDVETGGLYGLPGGLLCRDLAARGYDVYEAIDYFLVWGLPSNMDADGNGIPCESVYPDAAQAWADAGL